MNQKIKEFYLKVMKCNYDKRKCPIAWKNFQKGLVPRAFYPCLAKKALILVVAKNPGCPLKGEREYYKGKRGAGLFKAKDKFRLELLKRIKNGKDKSFKYHRNVFRYLRYFLGISRMLETYKDYINNYAVAHEKEISKYVAFTNLFKCSTRNEQQKLTQEMIFPCYERHFGKELELMRPKVILAFGNEVTGFLKKQKLRIPIVSIKHPSYFYRKDKELGHLKKIKLELGRHIDNKRDN